MTTIRSACALLLLAIGIVLATDRGTSHRIGTPPGQFFTVQPISGRAVFPVPDPGQRTIVAVTNPDPQGLRTLTVRCAKLEAVNARLSTLERAAAGLAVRPATATLRHSATELGDRTSPAATRGFRVHTGDGPFHDGRFYRTISAPLVGANDSIAIYCDPLSARVGETRIAALTAAFESVSRSVEQLLGSTAPDVDGDGRFSVLLMPPRRTRKSPLAWVRPADYSRSATAGVSNHCDVMYLAADFPDRPHLDALLAHEYAHAICCFQRPDICEEDWLHEAIAHCVERTVTAAPQNTAHRIARFLEHPHQYPLTVADYFSAGLYREHGCRGAVILFAEMLQRHHGPRLIRSLSVSSRTGMASVASAAGRPSRAVLRDWAVDLLLMIPGEVAAPPPSDQNGFLNIGPRTIPLSDSGALQVPVAGSATAVIEIPPGLTDAVAVALCDGSAPLITVTALPPQPQLAVRTRLDGDRVAVTIDCSNTPPPTEIIAALECSEAGRSKALGMRTLEQADRIATCSFELSGHARDCRSDSLLLKVQARFEDGRTTSHRVTIRRPR